MFFFSVLARPSGFGSETVERSTLEPVSDRRSGMGLGDGASISFQAHNETMVAARSDDAWMYTASGRRVSTSVKGFSTDGRLRWC